MALLPIIEAPDPRLRTKSTPVESVDDDTRKLLDDMLETMYAAPGVGLSAIQVGVPKRVMVVDCAPDGSEPQPIYLVNPTIREASEALRAYEEGCLSIPINGICPFILHTGVCLHGLLFRIKFQPFHWEYTSP